jgi:hypothetical protein
MRQRRDDEHWAPWVIETLSEERVDAGLIRCRWFLVGTEVAVAVVHLPG